MNLIIDLIFYKKKDFQIFNSVVNMANLIQAKIKNIPNFPAGSDVLFAALFIAEKIRLIRNHATNRQKPEISKMQISRIREKSNEFLTFRQNVSKFQTISEIEDYLTIQINFYFRNNKKTELEPIRLSEKPFHEHVNLLTTSKNRNIFRLVIKILMSLKQRWLNCDKSHPAEKSNSGACKSHGNKIPSQSHICF